LLNLLIVFVEMKIESELDEQAEETKQVEGWSQCILCLNLINGWGELR
jgi:hypothetical protein